MEIVCKADFGNAWQNRSLSDSVKKKTSKKAFPYKELFRILAARNLEREQKLHKGGAGKPREGTLTTPRFQKKRPLVFSVEFIYLLIDNFATELKS